MDAFDYQTAMVARLPAYLRESVWHLGVISAVAPVLQRLDDTTVDVGDMLRTIGPTTILHDEVNFDNGESDELTSLFVVGNTVTGAISGTSGTIAAITFGTSTTGTARLTSIVGDNFVPGELLNTSNGHVSRCISTLYPVENNWTRNLGRLVGFERGLESDVLACKFMRAQIETNVSWGTIGNLYRISEALFGIGTVYLDDGGEAQTPVSVYGTARAAKMSINIEPSQAMTVRTSDYDRTLEQLRAAKPAGVAVFVTCTNTESGIGDTFKFGAIQLTVNAFSPTLSIGETLTQAVSGATGRVDSKTATTVLLYDETGTWVTGQPFSGSVTGANTATISTVAETGSHFYETLGPTLLVVEEI